MLYKDGWDTSKKRMEAWWNRELLDRVVLMVSAPRKAPLALKETLKKPASIDIEWTDPAYYVYKAEKSFAETYFGGDFYPNLSPYLGPGQMAGYMGSKITYAEDTVWYHEFLENWDNYKPFTFNTNQPHYLLTKKILDLSLKGNDSKWITGMADLGGALDLLSAARGTGNLLLDLVDSPELVLKAERNIQDLWFAYFNDIKGIMQKNMKGFSTTFNLWCKDDYYPIQCDFSAMISPAMYEEFVLSFIEEQTVKLTKSLYHLDGPEAIPHLDMILSLKKLSAVQWVPGAGKPTADDPVWYPMYKKIQGAGKSLDLWDCSKKNIEKVIDELDPRGLLIHLAPDQFKTEDEAKEMERMVGIWSERRIKKLG